MVRACRQPLTSSEDEMDAFIAVMLAVEFDLKKRAFGNWRDALKGRDVESTETTKATVAPKSQCEHHEVLRTDPGKLEAVS